MISSWSKKTKKRSCQRGRHLTRRELLQLLSATVLAQVLPAQRPSVYQLRSQGPATAIDQPRPPVVPPKGSVAHTYDIFDNHWCLGAQDASGNRPLFVLPAQAPKAWVEDQLSKLPPATYQWLHADEDGLLWVASASQLLYLDPHQPERGWTDLTPKLGITPQQRISALGDSPIHVLTLGLSSGDILEVIAKDLPPLRSFIPDPAREIIVDSDGGLWLRISSQWWYRLPESTSWHRNWRVLSRMPGGNHDLAGDTLDGNFYLAGGQTAGWGYPARPHVFDGIFCLSKRSKQWSVPATLSHPRFYNGTTAFERELWVIAGNQRDEQGLAHFLSSVEIYNPRTGTVRPGPTLPFPLEMPVSVCIGSRIYVAGGSDPELLMATRGHTYKSPGKLVSIGPGEDSWRLEPDAPFPLQAIAGAALQDTLYLAVPSIGLCSYNTITKRWKAIESPMKVRSPQITAFQGEIWVLGGRDGTDPFASHIYSPGKDSWSVGPTIPRELSWGAAGVFNETLILAGGADGRSYNNRTFVYAPPSSPERRE